MSFFTGLVNFANAGLTMASSEYNKTQRIINEIGDGAKMRGMVGIILGVALAVFGVMFVAFGYPWGLLSIGLSVPFFFVGFNNSKMGDNIKEVAINPLKYLDEDKCHKKLSEGTFMFEFMTKKFTHLILKGK